MLLAIDVGNTNVTLGLWDGKSWLEQWRLRTVHRKTVDEYWIDLRTLLGQEFGTAVKQVVLSSVVPPLTGTLTAMCVKYLDITNPLVVTSETNTGIMVKTETPSQVGADRIVNAVAAAELYGTPTIVIDMGTATTFDYVSADNELLGVVIAPGLQLSADALASRAAQLNRVLLEAPQSVLGRNTTQAMQSGLIYGYVGLIEGMIFRISHEMRAEPVIVGTGGLLAQIQPYTSMIEHIDPWLTLTGLRLISDRNK